VPYRECFIILCILTLLGKKIFAFYCLDIGFMGITFMLFHAGERIDRNVGKNLSSDCALFSVFKFAV